MSEIESFEDYWQRQLPVIEQLIDSDDPEKLVAIRLVCENAWLQADVLIRRKMLNMAQVFESERRENVGIMDNVNSILDGLIKIAKSLEQKSENQPRNDDGSG